MRYVWGFTINFIHNKFYFEKYQRGSEGTKSKLKGEALMLFTLTKNPAHKRKARVWTWLSQGWLNSTDLGPGLNWNPKTCSTLFVRSINSFVKTFSRTCISENTCSYLKYCTLYDNLYTILFWFIYFFGLAFFSKNTENICTWFLQKYPHFPEKVYSF